LSQDSTLSDMTTWLVATRWHTGSISVGTFGSIDPDSRCYNVNTWTFPSLSLFLGVLQKLDLVESNTESLHLCLSELRSFEQRSTGGVVVCQASRSECRQMVNLFLSSKVESLTSPTWEERTLLFAMLSPEKSAVVSEGHLMILDSDGLVPPIKPTVSRESLISLEQGCGPSSLTLDPLSNTLTLTIPASSLSESGLDSLWNVMRLGFPSAQKSTVPSEECEDDTKSG